jgi:hypothetical protein
MLILGATFPVLGRQASGEGRGRDGDHGGLMSPIKRRSLGGECTRCSTSRD